MGIGVHSLEIVVFFIHCLVNTFLQLTSNGTHGWNITENVYALNLSQTQFKLKDINL